MHGLVMRELAMRELAMQRLFFIQCLVYCLFKSCVWLKTPKKILFSNFTLELLCYLFHVITISILLQLEYEVLNKLNSLEETSSHK